MPAGEKEGNGAGLAQTSVFESNEPRTEGGQGTLKDPHGPNFWSFVSSEENGIERLKKKESGEAKARAQTSEKAKVARNTG